MIFFQRCRNFLILLVSFTLKMKTKKRYFALVMTAALAVFLYLTGGQGAPAGAEQEKIQGGRFILCVEGLVVGVEETSPSPFSRYYTCGSLFSAVLRLIRILR